MASTSLRDPAPKAVLFDLGNTLVSYYRREEFAPLLREAIVGISGELQRRGHPQDRKELLDRAFELNREREDHRVWPLAERLRELFGAPARDPGLMPQMAALFLRPIFRCARLDPLAPEVLGELRRRGLRTGIVSNTTWGSSGESWRADLERLGLSGAVDVMVFCTDVGWRKPAAQPFERALEQLGVTAADTVFVGDDADWDIAGSVDVGMRAILFDPSGESQSCPEITHIRKLPELLDIFPGGGVSEA